jgi:hypothetical protein
VEGEDWEHEDCTILGFAMPKRQEAQRHCSSYFLGFQKEEVHRSASLA